MDLECVYARPVARLIPNGAFYFFYGPEENTPKIFKIHSQAVALLILYVCLFRVVIKNNKKKTVAPT